MMKRTKGAGGVFLGASGIGVSESVAVGALGIAVGLRSLLDFEMPREEEEGWGKNGNVVDPNPIPRGCSYIWVLPATLTLRESYPRVTRLMTHCES